VELAQVATKVKDIPVTLRSTLRPSFSRILWNPLARVPKRSKNGFIDAYEPVFLPKSLENPYIRLESLKVQLIGLIKLK
jgi:hypothetical protein